jgi:hypothetical protein
MAPTSSIGDVALPFHPDDPSFNCTNALYLRMVAFLRGERRS